MAPDHKPNRIDRNEGAEIAALAYLTLCFYLFSHGHFLTLGVVGAIGLIWIVFSN